MDDFINSESMLDIFLVETSEILDKLDDVILLAEKENDFKKEYIDEIFRIMHTIKGSSAMMNYSYIASLSHKMEDFFSFLRKNKLDPIHNGTVFHLLFDICDFFKDQIDKIRNGESLDHDVHFLDEQIAECLSTITRVTETKDNTNILESDNNVLFAQNDDLTKSSNKDESFIDSNKYNLEKLKEENYDDFNNYINDVLLYNTTSKNSEKEYTIIVNFDDDCGMEHLRAFLLIESIKDVCDSFSYFPENIENNPDCCDYIMKKGFYIFLYNSKNLDSIENIIKDSINVKTYQILDGIVKDNSNKELINFDHSINIPEIPVSSINDESYLGDELSNINDDNNIYVKNIKQNLINVNLSKIDKLMDIVGEIVIAESIISSDPDLKALKLDNFIKSSLHLRKLILELQNNVMSIRMVPISTVFKKMNRVVRDISKKLNKKVELVIILRKLILELQNNVMSIRMVPISTVFKKMNRVVRDISKKLNKKVELVIIDEGTEVDKTIIDSISDPIIHIIRNAIDHGIEKSDVRAEKGKPPIGRIILFAQNTGGEIVIAVSDDGRGVCIENVLEEAETSGLLIKPKDEYTKKEILSLILMPGFSTKQNVTEFSGRGVGMDIVKKNIEKIGGMVYIDSLKDKGTTIIIKIPITLAIISGLEIGIGSHTYTIPLNSIFQSFSVKKSDIIRNSDGEYVVVRGDQCYPVIKLYEFYNIDTDVVNIEDGILIQVVVENKNYCLLVDRIIGERQVVVKPLPKYLDIFDVKKYGLAGCTILGNGNVSLILDIYSLVEFYYKEEIL